MKKTVKKAVKPAMKKPATSKMPMMKKGGKC
jgi:hypothetical protein